jgi:hypothetical protein
MKNTRLFARGSGLILFVSAFLLALSAPVNGQIATSSIRGTVTDAHGNVVPGATVTLTQVERRFSRTQTTTDSGSYDFTSLQPGRYRLEIEAKGFKKATINDIRALVDKPTDVPAVQLEAGNVTETVTIQATGVEALTNKEDATIGNNFVSHQITQLPLESQNVFQLLSLQPGVTQDGYVAGARSDQSNLTLDGVDVNENQTGEAFGSVLRVTPASVEEFRVTITNPNASQGRSSGAQVSLVTKSGTNDFHGSLYEFHRNTVFTANDFFNNRDGIPRPTLLRNVFGGTIGGPIKKDRLFFFYNYEGRRDASQRSVVNVVPTASLGAGNVKFPDGSGGVTTLSLAQLNSLFPAVGMNPAAISLLASAAARYPVNDNTSGDGFNTGGFRFNAPVKVKFNTNIARFDWNVTRNGKHVIFLRGNYQQDLSVNPSDITTQQFPDTPAPTSWNHPIGFVIGHTWTINSRMVNTFHYGLTREAFSNQGDSNQNQITFRGVFQQFLYSRTFSRTTPVNNFTDDFSWIHGKHTLQFGANIRTVRNNRLSFAKAFDSASTNYFFYATSGNSLTKPILAAGYTIGGGFTVPVRAAVAALIGRFSQYSENFNFDHDLSLQQSGAGQHRILASEAYDGYIQDSWKLRRNLTITGGLRYTLSTPVYETQGFEAKPNIPLTDFFEQRVAAANAGQPFNTLLTVDLAGPVNHRSGYYPTDKNNFQPRIAVAWQPNYKHGFMHRLFGAEGDSVIRAGFARVTDYFGQALAVTFEANNTLGFSSTTTIAANSYNASTRPGPLFSGLDMTIRGLPGIPVQTSISFPQLKPSDMRRRIEGSLDERLKTPYNLVWDLSFGRKLPHGLYLEASYIGRQGRRLLATRDVATPVDLVDPKSGMHWYQAAAILQNLALKGTATTSVPNLPFFDHFYAGLGSTYANFFGNSFYNGLTPTQAVYASMYDVDNAQDCSIGADWTSEQDCLDSATGIPYFYNTQYGALAAWSTIGNSIYHAGTITLRERFKNHLTFDFNYTLSRSVDDASGLQGGNVYIGGGLVLNPFTQRTSRGASDFDLRHIINFNSVWQLPVGRHQRFLGGMNKYANAILGGWEVSSIFRWNSGLPLSAPFDAGMWSTNWEIESNGVAATPVQTNPNRGGLLPPNVFGDPVAAYRSFRNSLPGEAGDRNTMRLPGYIDLDMGLAKSFRMPWKENHTLEIRWDVFNVTNTQRMGALEDAHYDLEFDPAHGTPSPKFGTFTGIQGAPRVMQVGIRYRF